MIKDIRDRTLYMLDNSTVDYSKYNWDFVSTHEYKSQLPDFFEVIPIALTMDQVRQYNLPANYAKESNNLTAWYEEKFGTKECWEVDALDGVVLSDILERTIINLIDSSIYENVIQQENDDKQILNNFIDNYEDHSNDNN